MNNRNTIYKNLVARNSHRPEIKLSQSVMVGLLGLRTRGSIAHPCTFIGVSLPAHTNGAFQNSDRLFSTSGNNLAPKKGGENLPSIRQHLAFAFNSSNAATDNTDLNNSLANNSNQDNSNANNTSHSPQSEVPEDQNNNSPPSNNSSPSPQSEVPAEDQNNNSSNEGSGYETDSNRSYFEEGADSMASHPARDIPEDQLRRYIRDTQNIKRNPDMAGIEGDQEGNQELRQF